MCFRVAKGRLAMLSLNITRTVIVASISATVLSYQSKPIVVTEIHVDGLPPPKSLTAAAHAADAIGLVTVLSSRAMTPPMADFARTIYSIRVDDQIKSHSMFTPFVDIFRDGGDVDEGSQINRYIEVDFPRYKEGSQYVLLLAYNQHYNMFQPASGAESSFEIGPSQLVVPLGHSLLAQAQRGRSSSAFIAQLKQIVQGSGLN
jgi:hypothetical protein